MLPPLRIPRHLNQLQVAPAAQGWWEESSRFGMTSSVEKSELIEEKGPVE
jgi:hypothetical protein